jgi:hypothetical protein
MNLATRYLIVCALTFFAFASVRPVSAAEAGDWFERLAVPLAQADSFEEMRDESLKGVGLYPVTQLMPGPWNVLGPFDPATTANVPLRNIDTVSTFSAGQDVIVWQPVPGPVGTTASIDLLPLFERKENAVAYLYRSIQAAGEASVAITLSADDAFAAWLNGKEIFPRTVDGGDAAPGRHSTRVFLKPGENEILIRVEQVSGPWHVYFGLEPKIDPRVKAKILYEALEAIPKDPAGYATRVELAQLLDELGLVERALQQANRVSLDEDAPPPSRAAARAFLDRFLAIDLQSANKWNLFGPDDLTSGAIALDLQLTNQTASTETGEVEFRVSDIWANQTTPIPSLPYSLGPGSSWHRPVSFAPPGWGAFQVTAEIRYKDVPIRRETDVSYIPAPHPGLRPESFFAVTPEGDGDLEMIRKIGGKVVRGFFCNPSWVLKSIPETTAGPIELDFSRLDAEVSRHADRELSIFPIVGYAEPEALRSSVARRLGTTGPPRDPEEFTSMTVPIVSHLKDIRFWDFWDAPEIMGPTWSDDASDFLYFYKVWARKVAEVRPDAHVLVGGRPAFFADIFSLEPSAVEALGGLTNATYFDDTAETWRSGAQQRSLDFAVREAHQHESPYALVTESGTTRNRIEPGLARGQRTDAAKLVKLHALIALAGCYQANIHQAQGWGQSCPAGNAAYAVMTHLLEDRVIAADVWPAHPLIHGAVFAHPGRITDEVRSLPRADTIGVRWDVKPVKDATEPPAAVAIVWCETGLDAQRIDRAGTLNIEPAGDIRALDLMGNPAGTRKGDRLAIPFSPDPVYLLSDSLGVVELRNRIAGARIEKITPVTAYAFSLPSPLENGPTTLTIRVQNHLNRPVHGTMAPRGPADWRLEPTSRSIELAPAELAEVDFRLQASTTSPLNQYPLAIAIDTDAGRVEPRQVIGVACIQKLTPKVDGVIDEWSTGSFTRMDVVMQADPESFLAWLADPRQPRDLPQDRAFVGVDLAAAWDARFVYIAAVIHEPGLGNDTGGNPRSTGENPLTNGDCLELVFGFGDRADDAFRDEGDPWYWNGVFRDGDYSAIVFRQRADVPFLQSLSIPGLPWRTAYQSRQKGTTFNIGRSDVKYVRNQPNQTTTYEIAIPRSYLRGFDPDASFCRFGYVYFNDEKLAPLEWSRANGVFDYWANFGSYLPAWQARLPCQTRWGIEN